MTIEQSCKTEEESPSINSLVFSEKGNLVPEPEISDRIFTLANVISFIRLCLIPVFFTLMMLDDFIVAGAIFGIAAITDCLDGQIARRTKTVTKLGKLLDPAVDRLLMISGVLAVYMVDRIPLWVIIIVLARDIAMLFFAARLLDKHRIRVDVILSGKVATTLSFIGFFLLIINFPILPGLGIATVSWLPGLNADPASLGIWLVYAGLILAVLTTFYYATTAYELVHASASNTSQEDEHE